jgi:hypothetical protein
MENNEKVKRESVPLQLKSSESDVPNYQTIRGEPAFNIEIPTFGHGPGSFPENERPTSIDLIENWRKKKFLSSKKNPLQQFEQSIRSSEPSRDRFFRKCLRVTFAGNLWL